MPNIWEKKSMAYIVGEIIPQCLKDPHTNTCMLSRPTSWGDGSDISNSRQTRQ